MRTREAFTREREREEREREEREREREEREREREREQPCVPSVAHEDSRDERIATTNLECLEFEPSTPGFRV